MHKCHYCDFNSHVFASPPWEDYTKALIRELEFYASAPQFAGRSVASVFFGGGTPSLAPASLFQSVLDTVRSHFELDSNAEISLEANPGASDAQRFADYREAGINRVSIGVQSFNDKELKWLERIHSADEAKLAYGIAREAGFENINLDLMYALPEQTLDDWFVSLHQAMLLKPEHLSCYQLTIEPHTQLHLTHQKKQLALPDEDLALEFFWQTRERLKDAGYHAYEISNFSQKGKHCQHNCGYWLYDDYIGIGAGASGKWDTQDGGVLRYSNLRSPQTYMDTVLAQGKGVGSHELLNKDQAMGEAVWLGLRQSQGVDTAWFKKRFNQPLEATSPNILQQWMSLGKLVKISHHICLSEAGLPLADEISASFLS